MRNFILIILLLFSSVLFAEEDTTNIRHYKSSEVIILDDYFGISDKDIEETINSTEDILKQKNEIDLISRANFASEAVVRGYTQERLNVTIDGMRLFSACIDKMDPITSYIEVENLSKTEVNSDKSNLSNGISTGGSLNFMTNKPNHNQEFRFISDNQFNSVSDAYNSRGSLQFGNETIASLASYSVKRSSDYRAGNNTMINNSSYSKENLKFNLSYNSDESINHSVEYIYDHSADVYYPALIMDTRYTHMNMASYNLKLKNLGNEYYDFDTKVYYNSVEHLMDDYDRSEEEINNRIVMPGMYMPMYGETKTFGLNSRVKKMLSNGILSLSFEGYNMNAFADMDMEMLETDERMYLTNLGDINTTKLGLSIGYLASLNQDVTYRLNSRYDISYRSMNNDFARAITESFWQGNNTSTYNILNFSAGLGYNLSENSELDVTISRIEREPSHLENFGFYIYNISDNSIYVGSPNLEKEKSYSVNLGYSYNSSFIEFSAKVYNDYLVDYIAGTNDESINIFDGFGQSFKQFDNIGNANVAGLELSARFELDKEFYINSQLKYQNTHSFRYNEPLPFTPPLSGNFSFIYSSEKLKSIASVNFASNQNEVSYFILREDFTDSYAVINLRNSYRFNDDIKVRFGVENILDELYHTHFSINNLPNPGRNFYLGLSFGF